eukprot:6438817-Amphidinium_carterae.1
MKTAVNTRPMSWRSSLEIGAGLFHRWPHAWRMNLRYLPTVSIAMVDQQAVDTLLVTLNSVSAALCHMWVRVDQSPPMFELFVCFCFCSSSKLSNTPQVYW